MIVSHLFYFIFIFWTATAKADLAETARPLSCSSEQFKLPATSGVRLLSIEAQEQHNYTSSSGGKQSELNGLNFCQVKLYVTHQTKEDILLGRTDTNDKVLIEVWLPLTAEDWNGRFQTTGGGGFMTGMFDAQLGVAVQNGWAAVSTDGGHDCGPGKAGDASWTLKEDRTIDWNLLQNFAFRSLVEQISIGKSIVEQYYGTAPHHTYWNGCSTGGRQGYAIAQRYPHLVDGILANAPAISFTQLVLADYWPQLQMKLLNTYMSNCELEWWRTTCIRHCETNDSDGVIDGILEDPDECSINPFDIEALAEPFHCDGQKVQFSHDMALLIDAIHRGPKLAWQAGYGMFPGLPYGAPMTALANTKVSDDGVRTQNPFGISESFIKYMILKDPEANLSTLDRNWYDALFGKAAYEFGGLLNADNPDLMALRDSGTKMLTWHGMADEMISFQNTVDYREKVEKAMGGAHEVDKYFRLFLAPGLEHCGGGVGPGLSDPLAALVDWVEHDSPPETLEAETTNAEGDLVTREVCKWPAKQKYMGVGDPKRASSWSCVGGTETPPKPAKEYDGSRAQQVMQGLMGRWEDLGLIPSQVGI
jgi:pimeloyl-ACP methyl ester carboxylesterase